MKEEDTLAEDPYRATALEDGDEVGVAPGAATLDTLPSTGLLSFYDRLRMRIVRALESRGGKIGGRTAEALMLVPDVFILTVRLTLDREVPRSARMLLAGALVYFVVPVDLLPEAVVGAAGFVDDLVLAVAMLAQAFGRDLEPYAQKHWSGPRPVRTVLRDVLDTAHSLVGVNLYDRLRRLLLRRGVDLDAVTAEAGHGGVGR